MRSVHWQKAGKPKQENWNDRKVRMTGKPEWPEKPERQEWSLRQSIIATMHPAPIGEADQNIIY